MQKPIMDEEDEIAAVRQELELERRANEILRSAFLSLTNRVELYEEAIKQMHNLLPNRDQ